MTSQQLDEKYSQLTGIRTSVSELIEAASTAEEKKKTYDHLMWHIKNGLIRGVDGIKELVEEVLPALAEALEQPSTAEPSEEDESKYTAEEAAAYNLQLDSALQYGAIKTPAVKAQDAVEAQNAIYSFESFGDEEATNKYGDGTVEVTEMRAGGATVKVLTNEALDPNAEDFVGQEFNVALGLEENKPLRLHTLDNEPVDIWVVVTLVSEAIEAQDAVEAQDAIPYTNEEVDAYNATLPGAVHAGDTKTNA